MGKQWFSTRTWDYCSAADRSYRPTRDTGTIEQGNTNTVPVAVPPAKELPESTIEEDDEEVEQDGVVEEATPLVAIVLAPTTCSDSCRRPNGTTSARARWHQQHRHFADFLPQVSA